jgi:hypothetical protein
LAEVVFHSALHEAVAVAGRIVDAEVLIRLDLEVPAQSIKRHG